MSYQHPDYVKTYQNRTDWNMTVYTGYNSKISKEYEAYVYADGWTSIDGDEWWGEFPSLTDAEKYLHLKFFKEDR